MEQYTKKLFLKIYKKYSRRQAGFTLVELIVVMAMLGILFSVLLFTLNPLNQLSKVKDATRYHDLVSVKTALDSYYSDKKCYPTSIPFGSSFTSGNVVYMKKVPSDPDNYAYYYQSNNSCPQWNVLYGSLQSTTVNTQGKTSCALSNLPNCLPSNFSQSGYNFCITSGDVDCLFISQSVLPTIALPTPGQNGGATATPTPNCTKQYKCTGADAQYPLGICNIVTANQNPDYCGTPGCFGNSCCNNKCSR